MPRPDNSRSILIAAIITGSLLMGMVVMALIGLYERLGVLPSVGIVVADFLTIGAIWLLALTGRLGGPQK